VTLAAMPRLLGALLLAWCLAATGRADDGLRVTGAWLREAPPTATVHAAYLTLENPGATAVRIDSVTSPDFDGAEIHRSWIEDGVARMQAVAQLEVPAGGSLALEPGGYHLMLFDARRPLQAGDAVTLLLHLADGNCIRVSAPVRRATDTGHHHH
jgi:copper(I)-binding protein